MNDPSAILNQQRKTKRRKVEKDFWIMVYSGQYAKEYVDGYARKEKRAKTKQR